MKRIMVSALLVGMIGTSIGIHAEDSTASALGQLQDSLENSIEALSSAGQALQDGDRAASASGLTAAQTQAVAMNTLALDAAIATALGKQAKQIQKSVAAFQTKLMRAATLADDSGQNIKTVQKAVNSSFQSAGRVAKAVLKVKTAGPLVILEEKNARTAGFHKPGDVVTFLVHCLGSATDPVDITIVESVGGVIASSTLLQVGANKSFAVVMGKTKGSAVVTATWQGRTSRRLLYNSGETEAAPVPPTVGKGQLVLSYSVAYKGVTVTGVMTFSQVVAAAGFTPSIPGWYHLDSDSGNLVTSFAAAGMNDTTVGQDKTTGAYLLTWGSGPAAQLSFKADSANNLTGFSIVSNGIEAVTYILASNDTLYDGNVTTGTFSK